MTPEREKEYDYLAYFWAHITDFVSEGQALEVEERYTEETGLRVPEVWRTSLGKGEGEEP